MLNKLFAKAMIYVKLGRLSNIPTIWSNVLVGVALTGGFCFPSLLIILLLSLSCRYVAGMFLNDVCDSEIDLKKRPDRPIPSGKISRKKAYWIAILLLFVGSFLLLFTAYLSKRLSPYLFLLDMLLNSAIILYDLHHHQSFFLAPVLMGLCRSLTYLLPALFVSGGTLALSQLFFPLLIAGYIISITIKAKSESSPCSQNRKAIAFVKIFRYTTCKCANYLPFLRHKEGINIPLSLFEKETDPFILTIYNLISNYILIAFWLPIVAIFPFLKWNFLDMPFLISLLILFFILLKKMSYSGPFFHLIELLIASICLWDALTLVVLGHFIYAVISILFFVATILLHRKIPGS